MGRASSHRTKTSLPACASCKCDVGKEAGKLPFNVDDSASTSGEKAKHECFCPTCFVYVRSPREPARWRPGFFIAFRCPGCGIEDVAIGRDTCLNCRARFTEKDILLPRPGVV